MMNKSFKPLVVLTMLLSGGLAAYAQTTSQGSSNYSGFGSSALTNSSVTPFRSTTQDLNALFEGNALVAQGSLLLNAMSSGTATPSTSGYAGYILPYFMTTITNASSTMPIVQSTSLAMQTLVTTLGLPSGFSSTNNVINQAATNLITNVTAGAASLNLSASMADVQSADASAPSGLNISGNIMTASPGALAPYNAQTIMYPNPNNYNYITSSTGVGSNAQQYLALVTGSIAPVSGMMTQSSFSGSNATQNFNAYQLMVAREAAVQTAAADVLQQFAMNNAPMTIEASALGDTFTSSKMVPSINNVEQFMASRRLDPNSGWYYRVAQGSSLELQRENLYLQAENLYELNQLHKELQKQSMLLSMLLLEQTRSNISMLNQSNQVTAAQTGSAASASSASTTSVSADDSSTTSSSTSSSATASMM